MSEATSASPLRSRLAEFGRCVCQGARLMVGFPDYDTYVEHMKRTHPDRAAVMTFRSFSANARPRVMARAAAKAFAAVNPAL